MRILRVLSTDEVLLTVHDKAMLPTSAVIKVQSV